MIAVIRRSTEREALRALWEITGKEPGPFAAYSEWREYFEELEAARRTAAAVLEGRK